MNAETFYPWTHLCSFSAVDFFVVVLLSAIVCLGFVLLCYSLESWIRLKECQEELLRALREVDGEDVSFLQTWRESD